MSGGNEMNRNCGSELVPTKGLYPGARGGRGAAFQAASGPASSLLLLPHFLLCSPFLCCRLGSQAQLCPLRLVGGMDSGRLEEVLTNGPPGGLQRRASLETRGRKGSAWEPGLLQPPSASLGFCLGHSPWTRERNLSPVPSWGLCLLALEGLKSSHTCPGTLP